MGATIKGIPANITELHGTVPLRVKRQFDRDMDQVIFIYQDHRYVLFGEKCCCDAARISFADEVHELGGQKIIGTNQVGEEYTFYADIPYSVEWVNQNDECSASIGFVKLNGRGGL